MGTTGYKVISTQCQIYLNHMLIILSALPILKLLQNIS